MSETLINVENASKKFCRTLKKSLWYGVQDLGNEIRHRERLPGIKHRALVCQFGGAVGTLATLGEDGMAVLEALARELGLETPAISWHTARDGWAEAVFRLAMVGATLAKIATEPSIPCNGKVWRTVAHASTSTATPDRSRWTTTAIAPASMSSWTRSRGSRPSHSASSGWLRMTRMAAHASC